MTLDASKLISEQYWANAVANRSRSEQKNLYITMTTRPVILPASARSHLALAPRQAWLKDVDLKSHNIATLPFSKFRSTGGRDPNR